MEQEFLYELDPNHSSVFSQAMARAHMDMAAAAGFPPLGYIDQQGGYYYPEPPPMGSMPTTPAHPDDDEQSHHHRGNVGIETILVNGKSKDAKYKCTLCDRTFSRLYNVKSHIRTHENQRPHVCDMCGAKFARYSIDEFDFL
jgi:hypothetical protein